MPLARIPISSVPQSILESCATVPRDYTTAFIVDGQLAGSGTFVRVGDYAGILTARHVWENVSNLAQKTNEVGLMIASFRHSYSIPLNHLVPLLNLERCSQAFGPDVEFIRLPPAKVGAIAAKKSFYNLSKDPEVKILGARNRAGFHLVMGFPDQLTQLAEDLNRKVRLITLRQEAMQLGKGRTRSVAGFDYWEMNAQVTVSSKIRHFGGVSGAGVWKIILVKKKHESLSALKPQNYFLCGVAFYQSRLKRERRFLRMHGPHTIYDRLPNLLLAKTN